jgi:SAM-dependent methyltransferase
MEEIIYRDNQRHFDEGVGSNYASARQRSPANRAYRAYYDFWSEQLIDLVSISLRDATVLDCMSGSCELARVLKSRVRSLHAIDISRTLLSYVTPGDAQPDNKICGDVHCLPFRNDAFDVVFIRGGLHHIANTFPSAIENAGYTNIEFFPFAYLGYALIGNTDILPAFRNLRHRWVISGLLQFDRISALIPIWRHTALLVCVRARKRDRIT